MFLPLRQPKRKQHAAVKHAPCGPVFVPVDRGPEAARERIGKKIRARAPHLAFAVSACRPERRPAQSEVIYPVTEIGTACQGKSDWLFGVALRPEPVDAARAVEPLVGLGFALEALDVANLDPGTMSLKLPIAFGDALDLEGNANLRSFSHAQR